MATSFDTFIRQRFTTACIAAAIVSLLNAPSVSAQVIRLHKQISSDPRENVRLGDMATISGADPKTAESLMNLIVLPQVTESRSVPAEAVLMAVIAQVGPGPLADRLQIAGAANCNIQVGVKASVAVHAALSSHAPASVLAAAPALAPSAMNASAPAGTSAAKVSPKPQGPTLSQLIIKELQEDLGVGADEIRVNFATGSPLLDQPAPAGRQWVLRSLTRSYLGTIQFEAQLVDGPRIVQKLNVQMRVLKKLPILMATNTIARGNVVTKSLFKRDDAWIDRNMPTLYSNESDVVGLEAVRDISAGTMLDQRDFRPVMMAAQGDAISVIFMHGNLKVQMKARAMGSGKLHDSIQVKNEATNELYDAVLIGKRLAVVGGTLSEAQEKQLREAR